MHANPKPTLIDLFAREGATMHFAPGELVFSEGDRSDAVYLVAHGQLKIFSADRFGREVVFNIVHAGEIVGELLLDGGPRSASVRALTPVDCIKIGEERFRELIKESPANSDLVINHLIGLVRKATGKMRSLALDGVYERVVNTLNETVVDTADGRFVPETLTQQEIASRVGASREMVNYIVRELIRGGFILRRGRRSLQILKKFPLHW